MQTISCLGARRAAVAWVVGWTPLALAAPPLASSVPTSATGQLAVRVDREVAATLATTVSDYEWFHAHPELSEQEVQSSARMAERLGALGMEVHQGIGGHGVVGILRARNPRGPVVLFRADMDGLPIEEKTGLTYTSQTPGVMHACGHDVHMANALGTLAVLKALDEVWSGTVLFVAQPAEEVGRGARAMLGDARFLALLKKVGTPRVALALHDADDVPAGHVSLLPGFAYAHVDSVDVTLYGKGGHGARPHETVDPVVMGAEVVLSLQTIVSRRVAPGEPAVITVGKFAAGTKHNIVASEAELLITVRSYSDETRSLLLREIERVAKNVAAAHNAPKAPKVQVLDEFTPAAYNDPEWTQKVSARFVDVLGAARVETHTAQMGGEDFGQFSRQLKIPGVMWKLGAQNAKLFARKKGNGLPGVHSDKWAPDARPTLATGITTMTWAILLALDAP